MYNYNQYQNCYNQYAYVNGIEGAKSFQIQPGKTVLLIDSWDNQEAIDLHHASSIMDEITKLRLKYKLHMKVERYLLDEAGISKEDQKFIQQ